MMRWTPQEWDARLEAHETWLATAGQEGQQLVAEDVDAWHLILRNRDFRQAILHNINFRDAFLEGSDFEEASLMHCDFRESTLTGVRWQNARIEFCEFTYAVMDTQIYTIGPIERVYWTFKCLPGPSWELQPDPSTPYWKYQGDAQTMIDQIRADGEATLAHKLMSAWRTLTLITLLEEDNDAESDAGPDDR